MYFINEPKCLMARYCRYSNDGQHCTTEDNKIVEDCPYLKSISQIAILAMELTEDYNK